MPTSEFSFSDPSQRLPIFNVYGNKRKADANVTFCDSQTIQHESQSMDPCAKRQCFGAQQPPEDDEMMEASGGCPGIEGAESMLQCAPATTKQAWNLSDQQLAPAQQDMQHHHLPSQLAHTHLHLHADHRHDDAELNNNNNNNNENYQISANMPLEYNQQQHHPQQVPWPASVHKSPRRSPDAAECQMEAAMVSMDSDFTPDHSQYIPSSQHSDDMNTDFCRQYCGVGTPSPTLGRVRCYCKPSWEGMMDLKPYISDIY